MPLAVAALLVAACTGSSQPSARPQPPTARASAVQASTVQAGTDLERATRDALHSPPLHDRNNKILWVSRIPLAAPDPLVIRATLAGSTRTAAVSVPGGPGPSIIDLPAPGCWTFHLSWSGHTDELKLRYVA